MPSVIWNHQEVASEDIHRPMAEELRWTAAECNPVGEVAEGRLLYRSA
jgi:hypothetical protein